MKPVHTRQTFHDDLDDVWRYLCGFSEVAADRLIDRVEDRTRPLANLPLMGRARPDIHPECRQLVVENYLILYRDTPEQVELVRLVHGARDLGAVDFPAEA